MVISAHLLKYRTERLRQSRRHNSKAALSEACCGRGRHTAVAARLRQTTNSVHRSGAQSHQNRARARTRVRASCCWTVRWAIGRRMFGSSRAYLASFSASTWSLFRSLCEIARNSRTFATMTSCPSSCNCSLIQIECVPASIATRAGATSVKKTHFSIAFGVVPEASPSTTSPYWLRVQ